MQLAATKKEVVLVLAEKHNPSLAEKQMFLLY
jgi:hypothetical protein